MASELRVDRIIPVNGVPTGGGGGIIKVVQTQLVGSTSSTTSTYADTGLSASITPTSSSNKILVIVYTGQCGKSAADTQLDFKVFRNSTEIYFFSTLNTNSAVADSSNVTIHYLDSPATTSSITYKTQVRNRNDSGTITSNSNGSAEMTLMEVSG